MSAKRFFYVAAGVFLLAAAYTLGARSVRADWEPGSQGQLIGGYAGLWWAANGEAWAINPPNVPWQRHPDSDLPVPASQVKFIDLSFLITIDDSAWHYGSGGWVNYGPPPWSVSTTDRSWSDVKEMYRK